MAGNLLSNSLRQSRPNINGSSFTLHDIFHRLTSKSTTLHSIGLYELGLRLNPNFTNPDPLRHWGDHSRCAEKRTPFDAPIIFLPLHKGLDNAGHFTLAVRTPNIDASTPTRPYRILYYDSLNEEVPPSSP